jgi:hypothetical protein
MACISLMTLFLGAISFIAIVLIGAVVGGTIVLLREQ